MAKYYVTTSGVDRVLQAKNPKEAARKVLQDLELKDNRTPLTQVGEKGFRHNCPTAVFYSTSRILSDK